jgi:hypothetical protein
MAKERTVRMPENAEGEGVVRLTDGEWGHAEVKLKQRRGGKDQG